MRKFEWAKADALPESEYDYSDAPELSDNFFRNMTVLMPDTTKNINIRVKNSYHYQSMISAVLDAYVESRVGKLAH